MSRRFALAVVLALAAGCRGAHQHEHAAPAAVKAHEHAHEAAAPATLQLDSGKRWKADASTTAAVGRMRALVDAAPASETQEAAALQALGDGLRKELDGLIAGCTMTGDAHAQLHVFIEPLFANAGALQSGDLAGARAAQDALKRRLAEYGTYFE